MDKSEKLYLITLEAIGSIGEEEYSRLFQVMQSDEDFPWKEMGEYQNLAALLSMAVDKELPAESLKETILNEIVRIKKVKAGMVAETEPKNYNPKIQKKDESFNNENIPDEMDSQGTDKEPGLKIIDHSDEFEEVKAKLSKIKNEEKKPPERKFQMSEDEAEETIFIKNPKKKKSQKKFFRKSYVLVSSIILIGIVAFAYFYLNFFDGDIEEQKKKAKQETEMLIAKSRILPKEQEPAVTLEKIEHVENQNEEPEQVNFSEEEIIAPEIQIEIPEQKIEQKKEELQKPDLPPMLTPDFIEAPLINEDIEEVSAKGKKDVKDLDYKTPEIELPPKQEIAVREEPVYFVAVEEMPEPIGGISGIQKKIIYPELAKRAGIEGKVLVLAFVDESGNVTKTEVIKGIGLGCDEAAINAILQTTFKPGKQRGKPVKVQVTIPVTFKL